MQFDLLRAFPYPVLRPKVNDYIDGDIQATISFEQSVDGLELSAEINFAVSVPEIAARIELEEARFVVVFECRDTYYRHPVMSGVNVFKFSFPVGSLRGEVIIKPYVVVTKAFKDFSSPWINEEFGKGPFSYAEGELLALDEPKTYYIDKESFKPISSAFVLVANENIVTHDWRVDASGDKVRIEVSPALKEKIDSARNANRNKAVLLNSIYFGSVMQCLSYLKQGGGDYEGYRWANIFQRKLEEAGLDIMQHDEAAIAQVLMKQPFSLLETYCFDGDDQ